MEFSEVRSIVKLEAQCIMLKGRAINKINLYTILKLDIIELKVQ